MRRAAESRDESCIARLLLLYCRFWGLNCRCRLLLSPLDSYRPHPNSRAPSSIVYSSSALTATLIFLSTDRYFSSMLRFDTSYTRS
ncbi:hypothetical protein BB8028_0005g10170 [Beauveria bassiana]|uniref:Uncharacterized protein n=1 Tax=Beauveria bassiana TaxID=176275 RepID=A0A2S7YHP2_BEABA|nr:hypothetical protein BB8028_0005g10170 [Beauveria bassiana]